MKKLPESFEQLKLYPQWTGVNDFFRVDPNSEQGKLNEKEEREDELKQMRYADGTPVGEMIEMDREIKIYCRAHGEFHCTPRKHLAGVGCPVCDRMGESELYPCVRPTEKGGQP